MKAVAYFYVMIGITVSWLTGYERPAKIVGCILFWPVVVVADMIESPLNFAHKAEWVRKGRSILEKGWNRVRWGRM